MVDYRVLLKAIAAGALLATAATGADAQSWPTKPIRVVAALSAGSAVDIIGRLVFDQVSQQIGQSIIIENRPGAGGTIAGGAVAKADPDGYTVLAHSNGHVTAPAFFARIPYDVNKDFAGVAQLGLLPHVVVIAPSQNIKSLQELVAAAKTRPGGITYAAVVGTAPHLNAVHFKETMKIEGRAVPFKGAPEALTEVITGRVDIYFSPISPALPLIADNKAVPLAVSSKKRSVALPNVPTTEEAGYPGPEFGLWVGAWLPVKTPREIVTRLNGEIIKALAAPKVAARLKDLGVEPGTMTPERFDAYCIEEAKISLAIAKAAGIQPQ